MKKILLLLFSLYTTSQALAQGAEEPGLEGTFSNIILCQEYTYKVDREEVTFDGNSVEQEWTVTNGTIVSSTEFENGRKEVTVVWEGNGTIEVTSIVATPDENTETIYNSKNVTYRSFSSDISKESITKYDEENATDNPTFLCKYDDITVTLNEISDHYPEMEYFWIFRNQGDERIRNYTGNTVNFTIPSDWEGDMDIIVKKQHQGCAYEEVEQKVISDPIEIKENPCNLISLEIENPKCHGSSQSTIIINGLPQSEDKYSIDIEALSSQAGIEIQGSVCETNGINYSEYYLMGQAENWDTIVSSSSYTIENKVGPGIYRISIANDDMCNYREFFEIQEPAELSLDGVSPVNSYTYNNETFHMQTPEGTGGIHLELSGGTPGYTYEVEKITNALSKTVNSENTSATINELEEGSYRVNISDANNCPVNTDDVNTIIELKAPDSLVAYKKNFIMESPSCHKDVDTSTNLDLLQDGEVIMKVQGGIGPYTGTLTNQKTINREFTTDENNDDPYALSFSDLPEGTYNYSLQDRFEHTVIEDQLVLVSPLPVTLKTKTIYPTICLGGNDGRLVVEPDLRSASDSVHFYPESPTSQEYTYDRYPGYSFEKLNEGYFEYRIKDSLDCIFTFRDSIPPNPNPPQLFIVDSTEISCFKADDGTVTLTGENGAPYPNNEYYFSLDGFNSGTTSEKDTAIFENLDPGSHDVFIDDTSECRNKQVDEDRYKTSFYVEEPEKLHLENSIADVAAYGDSTGSYLFSMSGGNGRYEYLAGRGEDTLQWGVMESDSIQLRKLRAGTYWLYYRDTCGCTNGGGEWAKESFYIAQPERPLEFTATVFPPSCHGGQDAMVELTGKGGWGDYRYGLDTAELKDQRFFSNLPAGNHRFWVEDRKGVRFSKSIHVPEPEPLEIAQIQIQGPACHGSSDGRINLQVRGGTPAYSVNGVDSQDGAVQLTGYSAGTIHLEIADANGCALQMDTTLHEPEPLNMAYDLQKATCGGTNGTIALTSVEGGTAPYSYSWYKNGTPMGTDSILQEVPSGFYELLLEDAGGCRMDTSFQLDNIEGPEGAILTTEAASCHGDRDGKVEIELIHCHHPGVYQLFKDNEMLKEEAINFSSGILQEELAAGHYTAVILDSNACRTSLPFVISEPAPLHVQQAMLQDPLCHDASSGRIAVEIGGGNGNYSYSWNDIAGDATLEGIPAGAYELLVQDQKGCHMDSLFQLTNPPALEVNLGEEATICGGQDYRFEPGNFASYAWYRNDSLLSTERYFTTQLEGRYLLEVESNKGCTVTDSFQLKISNDLLEADFLVPSPVETGDTLVAIDISWPAPDSVYWVFPEEAQRMESEEFMETFRFGEPGTYTLSLNAVKGECRDGISKTILVEQKEDERDELKGKQEGNISSCTIYPNPVRDVFHCKLELEQPAQIRLILLHAGTGQLVMLHELMGRTDNTFSYDLGGKQAGNYLLIIQSGEEKIQRTILHL